MSSPSTCDYILFEKSTVCSPVPVRHSSAGSRLVLLWKQTSVILTALIHYPETLNPENQLKHTQAFILKIPAAKTQGVLNEPRV